ncbi:LysR family transcriptional regulator [Bradyrhizobium diazoefficiens]|nr:LysR family transcriptional regulator [Bradyrhizobium diazoefficiens]QQN62232.1 LysR family transcriptional regulator [Bradyrhizobium diazoefficiens]
MKSFVFISAIIYVYAMELYQIRQFVAVVESGSFTRGAARASVSQPAISASIAKLELELGQKLLERRRGSVVPTGAGVKLLAKANEILSVCNSIKMDLRSTSEVNVLQIGVLRTLPTSHVAALLDAFRRCNPDVAVQLFEGTREDLEQRLGQKKLQLCLTSLKNCENRRNTVTLLTEPYVLAVSADHRLAKRPSILLQEIAGERFISRTGCETFQTTTALFRARGIRTNVVYRTDQDDRALGLVAAGVGVALMPALYHAPGVFNIPIKDFPLTRTIGLRWAPRAQKNEALQALITFTSNHSWGSDLFSGVNRRIVRTA